MAKPVKKGQKITRKKIRSHFISVVVMVVFCAVIVLPQGVNKGISWVNSKANVGIPQLPTAEFNLGLDLQGGAHLVYQADVSGVADKDKADSVEGVRDVIERRVRGGLGVSEPLVQTTKVGTDYRVIVELPGIDDVNNAIKMIGETPTLEFKEENSAPARALTDEEIKDLTDFNYKAAAKAEEALSDVVEAEKDFTKVVQEYSEDSDSVKQAGGVIGYVSSQEYPEIHKAAATLKDGEVYETLVQSAAGLNVIKRLSSKENGVEVRASHILICYDGAVGCENSSYKTREEAKKKIEELGTQVTAANFSAMAKQYSTEPAASQTGGDLGWFGLGTMVQGFEIAVFNMEKGAISSPIETKYGFHIIYKQDERKKIDYKVARVFIKTKSATDVVPPDSDWKSTGLSGKQLRRAEVTQDQQSGQVQVSLNFDSEGTDLFADITKRNTGKLVAIFLDGQPISIPRVNEPILSGSAVISGGFTIKDAQTLARRLNSGALPVPVELISQQKVDATLGSDSLRASYKAALAGLILVIIFMIIYYRLPGLLAALSLAIYGILALAIFKLIGVTLTLSGIAGFILSLGMAVDANVLIFERLREELHSGRSLRPSIEDAFNRAWPSIRDGNITTLLSAAFLIWFGTGFVQGFAVTLAIGVLSSMFTAIIITKTMMRFTSYWFKERGNRGFLGYRKEK